MRCFVAVLLVGLGAGCSSVAIGPDGGGSSSDGLTRGRPDAADDRPQQQDASVSCTSDNQCTPLGMLCDRGRGVCVGCLGATDCSPAQYCANGTCLPDVCTAGTLDCQANGLATCKNDGSGFDAPVPCPTGQVCSVTVGVGVCRNFSCTPSVTYCDPTSEKILVCAADGASATLKMDCGAGGRVCVAGACVPVVCSAGQRFCQGPSVRQCTAKGDSSSLVMSCVEGQYCDAASATCRAGVCMAGQPACNGNVRTTCNADGSGYVAGGTDCAPDTCQGGLCVGCSSTATCGDHLCSSPCETAPGCAADCGALVFTAGDARRAADTGNWAPNSYKAECGSYQAMIGLSVDVSISRAHAALCTPDSAATTPHGAATGCHALHFANNDVGTISTDWDLNYYKAECATTEFVAGVAQATTGEITDVLCCPGAVTHQSCNALMLGSGDVREPGAEAASGDWDYGYYKGECAPGRYVAGVSRAVSGPAAHGILCCNR